MSQPRRARAVLAGLSVASLVLITLDFRAGDDGPLSGVRAIVGDVVAPLQGLVSSLANPVGAAMSTVGNALEREEENARLREQVEELELAQQSYDQLVRERDELAALVGTVGDLALEGVAGRVIGDSASNFEWLVTIDVGRDDGVVLDQPVIDGDGLVGRVIQVGRSSARVLLAIDPSFFAASRSIGNGEVGTSQGQGGDLLRFVPIDPEAEFAVGDDVVTSSYELGVFPAGIPIGTIEDPGEMVSGLSRIVRVRPYVDFTSLDRVFVVDNAAAVDLPELDVDARDVPDEQVTP